MTHHHFQSYVLCDAEVDCIPYVGPGGLYGPERNANNEHEPIKQLQYNKGY